MTTRKVDQMGVNPVSVDAGSGSEREIAAGIGRRIARLRERRGWTPTELAKRLGVRRARLASWERGNHTPPLAALLALRRELGVSLDELFTGEPPPSTGLGQGQKLQAREHIARLVQVLGLSRDSDGAAAPREKKP